MTRDDFDYALENTHVILAPERQIATFGSTSFNFYLISELMDRVNQVRIRNGKIQAERPQILTPEHYCRLLLEASETRQSDTWINCVSTRRKSRCSVTVFNFARPI